MASAAVNKKPKPSGGGVKLSEEGVQTRIVDVLKDLVTDEKSQGTGGGLSRHSIRRAVFARLKPEEGVSRAQINAALKKGVERGIFEQPTKDSFRLVKEASDEESDEESESDSSDSEDDDVVSLTAAELTRSKNAGAELAEKQNGFTDRDAEDHKAPTWVRVRELNGWEKEEWFRWYPVNGQFDLWKKIAERVHAENSAGREIMMSAAARGIEELKRPQRDPMFAMLDSAMGGRTMNSQPNCGAAEVFVQFFNDAEKKRLEARPLLSFREVPDMDDDGDFDPKLATENNVYGIQETAAARAKNMWRYRQWFFKIGEAASYMSKHTEDRTPTNAQLESLLKKKKIMDSFYKAAAL